MGATRWSARAARSLAHLREHKQLARVEGKRQKWRPQEGAALRDSEVNQKQVWCAEWVGSPPSPANESLAAAARHRAFFSFGPAVLRSPPASRGALADNKRTLVFANIQKNKWFFRVAWIKARKWPTRCSGRRACCSCGCSGCWWAGNTPSSTTPNTSRSTSTKVGDLYVDLGATSEGAPVHRPPAGVTNEFSFFLFCYLGCVFCAQTRRTEMERGAAQDKYTKVGRRLRRRTILSLSAAALAQCACADLSCARARPSSREYYIRNVRSRKEKIVVYIL